MIKEGAWIVARDGRYRWITEHATWLQDPARARDLGLSGEAIGRIRAIAWDFNGPGRVAICLEGMRAGLIRFRGHGAAVTFESVLPLEDVLRAAGAFMASVLGPLTWVQVNRLDTGESWAGAYGELLARGPEALALHAPSPEPSLQPHPTKESHVLDPTL